jgi:hypothetical protein
MDKQEQTSPASAPGQTSATAVVADFLGHTSPDQVEAAARRLVAEDATYVSLNFDNPDLRKILAYTGTAKGRDAYVNTFTRVARYWTVEDFQISALFGTDEDVAVFGAFNYRSIALGKSFRSPFSVHAKVKDGKIVYFQFMEDTFASARSQSSAGTWTIKTDPDGVEFQV